MGGKGLRELLAELLISQLSLQHLVPGARNCSGFQNRSVFPECRYWCLQEASEVYQTGLFEAISPRAVQDKRATNTPNDIQPVGCLHKKKKKQA